jgi:hypothetical protein
MVMVKGIRFGAAKDKKPDSLALMSQRHPEAALDASFQVFAAARERVIQFQVLNVGITQFKVEFY